MMRQNNIQMTTTVDRLKLLETLRQNLATHRGIVREASDGYLKKAEAALEARLVSVRSAVADKAKLPQLDFNLHPPIDHSEVYETTIQMLEWSKDETIKLGADEFRQLVQDEWPWTDNWLTSNFAYSGSARTVGAAKGLI